MQSKKFINFSHKTANKIKETKERSHYSRVVITVKRLVAKVLKSGLVQYLYLGVVKNKLNNLIFVVRASCPREQDARTTYFYLMP
ncbi:hypothetical protein NIES22_24250 [Calothrix brevissima NIES-22]|nr:hypothetical protein NIES22_24250 [Calothrix brevissima NIES-22]